MRFDIALLLSTLLFASTLASLPALAFDPNTPAPDPAVCSLDYVLPGDVAPTTPGQEPDAEFMQFAWQTFLALNAPAPGETISVDGDNVPQWAHWSSTTDLINARNPGPSGDPYYPPICRLHPDHGDYRVLQQVSKIDDSFLEAGGTGLSSDPVIDRNGKFLRFEIKLNPALYNQAVEEKLYDRRTLNGRKNNVNLICGEASYTGGDPADPQIGSIALKAAWMDAGDLSDAEKSRYHVESSLVFTPAYRNATGLPTCELKEMALVGLHVARKTLSQQAWTWATWEHVESAPDCTEQMPNGRGGPVNTACPAEPEKDYNFFSSSCQDATSEGPCQVCNTPPEKNSRPKTPCSNPFDRGTCSEDPSIDCVTKSDCASKNAGTCMNAGWCLDLPPAEFAGKPRLCRQVPLNHGFCSEDPAITCTLDTDCSGQGAGTCDANYPKSNEWNAACWSAIDAAGTGTSVWRNYRLVGIQWFESSVGECQNVQELVLPPGEVVNYSQIEPQVQLLGDGTRGNALRPILGNTSMESYERSNCTGCHSKTGLQGICTTDPDVPCTTDLDCPGDGTCNQVTTDFMYWLKLEVGDPPAILSDGRFSRFRQRQAASGKKNRFRMRYADRVSYVPEELSAGDPRCFGQPPGTVKATLRIFSNQHKVDSFDIDLPCENWKSSHGGFRYRSREGTCHRVHIARGKRIVASCSGVDFLKRFVPAGGNLSAVLHLGNTRYCATFDDFNERERKNSNRFVSRTGSMGDQCPIPIEIIGLDPADL